MSSRIVKSFPCAMGLVLMSLVLYSAMAASQHPPPPPEGADQCKVIRRHRRTARIHLLPVCVRPHLILHFHRHRAHCQCRRNRKCCPLPRCLRCHLQHLMFHRNRPGPKSIQTQHMPVQQTDQWLPFNGSHRHKWPKHHQTRTRKPKSSY